jgi:MFS family permease
MLHNLTAAPRSDAFPAEPGRLYDSAFWKAFLANLLQTTAMAVLYHYADFVKQLGGSEVHLGWVVGIGMVGSLAMRLFVGTRIDYYGPRLVWTISLAMMAATCLAHLLVTHSGATLEHRGVMAVCAGLRIVFSCCVAGMYASSMTFISGRSPVIRMAEMLGMLGTAGFLGIIAGSWMGDLLLNGQFGAAATSDAMFLTAALLDLAALACALWATRESPRPIIRRRPPVWGLLWRYHPGWVMVMSMAMGFALAMPTIFLRPFAQQQGIGRIGLFFTVYAASAIITRVVARRLPERIGLRPVVLLGMGPLIGSQFLFLLVTSEWQLLIPAVTYGLGHAVLFPAGFAEGCSTFPSRYRGLGTSLMLAASDFGQFIGSPLAGQLIHYAPKFGLPGYGTMFVGMALMLSVAVGVYAASPRHPLMHRNRVRYRGVRGEG